nr:MAG TPA: 43 kDa tail protein [Caudoviricetes sp.]
MSEFVSGQKASLGAATPTNEKQLQLIIHNKETDKYYWPAVLDGVVWETCWKGQPGKLTFKVVKDAMLDFHEGDVVQANYDGMNFFYGYIFAKKYSKDGTIDVTAYDQMRYLKNKDTYNFVNLTAGEEIRRIAENFQLQVGELADTGYTIPKFRGANKTLMDIMQTLLDMTTQNTGRLYVLYDDFGKLTMKDLEDMKLDLLIDAETAEDFAYESSIDKDTYNRIKLYYDNKKTGKRDVWMAVNSADIKRWGVLQLTESVNPEEPMNFGQLADSKLKMYDRVKRTLTIKNAFGDLRVRGGSILYINLNLGDVALTKRVIVEAVKHTLTQGHHTMDLTVKGDVITG